MEFGSVSQWVVELRKGEQDAAERLWHRYYRRLVQWASRRLSASCGLEDEEDLAARTLKSFLLRIQQGQLTNVRHRDEVWRVLLTILRRKYFNLWRKWRCHRTNVSWEEHFQGGDGSTGPTNDTVIAPVDYVVLREQWMRIVSRLDDELKVILEDRLMGYTVVEIAARLRRSVPTVERRLRLLRALCREEGVFCPWE